MATHASVRRQVVIVVGVAIGALARRHRMQPSQRKGRKVVIERRVGPGSRVMALIAGLRKSGRHMVGIGGSLVILHVTGNAGRAGQVVIVVHVTIGALSRRHRMSAGKREANRAVVERSIQPVVGLVAEIARG